MTPENFDTFVLQAMNKFYSEIGEVAEHVNEFDQLDRQATGVRGWLKILFKKDGLEEVSDQRAQMEKIRVNSEYFMEKAKGTIWAMADVIEDTLEPRLAKAIINAIGSAAKNYAIQHERIHGYSVPNPSAFVSGLGKAIETAMYQTAQKRLTGV